MTNYVSRHKHITPTIHLSLLSIGSSISYNFFHAPSYRSLLISSPLIALNNFSLDTLHPEEAVCDYNNIIFNYPTFVSSRLLLLHFFLRFVTLLLNLTIYLIPAILSSLKLLFILFPALIS